MSGMNDVVVKIDVKKPMPRVGFGKPLILGASAEGSEYKTYSSLTGVAADFDEATEEYKAAAALFGQGDKSPAEVAIYCRKSETPEEGVAASVTKLLLKDWYFLVSTSDAVTDITAIADLIETDDSRQYFARTGNKADLATIQAKKYNRTTVMYHSNPGAYPEAAWIGACASKDVGSITWKFKTLAGIDPMDINATELKSIHDLGANTYVTKSGDDITSEGRTVSGEYIDNVHAKDYVKVNIETSVQKLLNSADKIPYDDGGIAQIEGVVLTVLQRSFNQGIIARDADGVGMYGTEFLPRAQTDETDRQARAYREGSFYFYLAGAIHSSAITGTIQF